MTMSLTSNRTLAVAGLVLVAFVVWAVITFIVPQPPTAEELGNAACARAGGAMTDITREDLDLYSWYVNRDGEVVKVTPGLADRVCAAPPSVYRTGEYKHPRQILTNY